MIVFNPGIPARKLKIRFANLEFTERDFPFGTEFFQKRGHEIFRIVHDIAV